MHQRKNRNTHNVRPPTPTKTHQSKHPSLLLFEFLRGKLFDTTHVPKSYVDHPIHPPTETSDPWDLEFPPDKNYCIRAVDGVYNVFQNEVNFL